MKPTLTILVGGLVGLLLCPPLLGVESSQAAAEVAFAYGLAAYQDEDLEEAERLFEKALAHQPDHPGARHWLDVVRGDREGDTATVYAPGFAGETIRVQGLPRWESRFELAFGDDSNSALLPEDLFARLPDGEILAGEASDTSLAADLRFEVHPFFDRGGWSLGLGVRGRQALFDDLDALDFQRTGAFVHLAWGGDPAGYLVGPLGYTRVPVGNRRVAFLLQGAFTDDELDGESFADALSLAAALTLREARSTATQIDLSWRDESFDGNGLFDPQERFTGDREELGARVSQFFYFAGRNGYLRLAAGAAERDAGGAFDSEVSELAAELSVPLSPRWFLFLAASTEEEDFDELESNPLFSTFLGDAPREDETTRLSAALTFAATRRLWVTVRGSRIDRDTDLGSADTVLDLDWDRTVASIGLRWFLDGGRVER